MGKGKKKKKKQEQEEVIIDFENEAEKRNKRHLKVTLLTSTILAFVVITLVFVIQIIFGNLKIEDYRIKNAKETAYMIYNKGLDNLSSYNDRSRIIVNYAEPGDATKLMQNGLKYTTYPDMIKFKITDSNLWEKITYEGDNVFKFYDDLGICYVKIWVKGDINLLPYYTYSIGIKPKFIITEIIIFVIAWIISFCYYYYEKEKSYIME